MKKNNPAEAFESIVAQYGYTDIGDVTPLGSGNIHDTYLVVAKEGSVVLQKINTTVFTNPDAISHNLSVVSAHLQNTDSTYCFPYPLMTLKGSYMVTDEAGNVWRALPYIADATSYNTVPTAEHAYNAAYAFADFSRRLMSLPVAELRYAIPDFHDLTLREEQFTTALLNATRERLDVAEATINEFKAYAWIGGYYRKALRAKLFAMRVHHHDTKINNVLFARSSAEVITLVDLDTIMPGYFYSDIGDLLMFGTSVFEDVIDLSQVVVDTNKWEAVIAGYTAGFRNELLPAEVAVLPFSGLIMCYMLGLRFLTDYLNGEIYFKTQYSGQNLDKAKNRLKLLTEMIKQVEIPVTQN